MNFGKKRLNAQKVFSSIIKWPIKQKVKALCACDGSPVQVDEVLRAENVY